MASDYKRLKEIIDLHEYLDTLASDRPRLSDMFKVLGINGKTVSDTIISASAAASICVPEAAVQIFNDVFKLGITIGYKYQVTKEMEREFGDPDDGGDPTPPSPDCPNDA